MNNENKAIDLAPLHGTILSIIIGIFSAYAISFYFRLDENIQSVLFEAEKINYINPVGSYGLSGAPEYQSNDDDNRKQLLSSLSKLVMGVTGLKGPSQGAETGAEILRIISALSNYYPFSQRARPTDEGGMSLGYFGPIKFDTIKDVQKWLNDIEEVVRLFFWLENVHKGKLYGRIKAFQLAQQREQPPMELPEDVKHHLSPEQLRDIEDSISTAAAIRGRSGSLLVDRFIKMLNQANLITSRVREALDRYQVQKRYVPSKSLLLVTIIFGAIAFVAAVILPMFFNNLLSFVWKVIPVIFYLYSLVILVLKAAYL